MKRKIAILTLAVATLALSGCHKSCTCVGYNSREHVFTADEVSTHASGNCSAMTDFPIPNRYSYCHWE